jgi:hypothetical protein
MGQVKKIMLKAGRLDSLLKTANVLFISLINGWMALFIYSYCTRADKLELNVSDKIEHVVLFSFFFLIPLFLSFMKSSMTAFLSGGVLSAAVSFIPYYCWYSGVNDGNYQGMDREYFFRGSLLIANYYTGAISSYLSCLFSRNACSTNINLVEVSIWSGLNCSNSILFMMVSLPLVTEYVFLFLPEFLNFEKLYPLIFIICTFFSWLHLRANVSSLMRAALSGGITGIIAGCATCLWMIRIHGHTDNEYILSEVRNLKILGILLFTFLGASTGAVLYAKKEYHKYFDQSR